MRRTPAYRRKVPLQVTLRQAKLALLGAGLLETVDATIAALEGPAGVAARIEWEYAQTVDRTSPLVQGLAAALSLSDEQLDDLFEVAAGL